MPIGKNSNGEIVGPPGWRPSQVPRNMSWGQEQKHRVDVDKAEAEDCWPFKNFTRGEVSCPCCGFSNMAYSTMEKFQNARDSLGRPIYGVSWCRCERHNEAVGGVKDSSHIATEDLECHAGDVTLARDRAMTSHERYILYRALLQAGFTRLGVAISYIHADDSPEKQKNVLWLY